MTTPASAAAATPAPGGAIRLLEYVPVFGFFLRSARLGGEMERWAFAANIFALWLIAVFTFGYPVLIVTVLGAAWLYLLMLVVLTSQGLWSRRDEE
ncbi:hypothetical protein [Stappia sp.]|jgi:hypothetical protein|uniref:hypothetical protein n=1 Tax=Stappia sp. TaxID=1870903 RepID=UPI003A9A37DE